MELEELKLIWDAQSREHVFALDESALHAMVQPRNDEFNRHALCRYSAEITIGLVCGTVMLLAAAVLGCAPAASLAGLPWPRTLPTAGDIVALVAAGAIWYYFAGYMNGARRRQQECGETFDATLRGDLDRALARVEFQIKVARGLVWRAQVPAWIASGLWVFVIYRLSVPRSPGWAFGLTGLVMVAAFILEATRKRAAIRDWYEPHRRELEALRAKLLDPAE